MRMSVRFVRVMNLSMAGATRPGANDKTISTTVSAERSRDGSFVRCGLAEHDVCGEWLRGGTEGWVMTFGKRVVGLVAHLQGF